MREKVSGLGKGGPRALLGSGAASTQRARVHRADGVSQVSVCAARSRGLVCLCTAIISTPGTLSVTQGQCGHEAAQRTPRFSKMRKAPCLLGWALVRE